MNTSLGSQTVLLFGGSSDERLVSVASSQNLSAQFPFTELWFFHFDGSITRADAQELRAHERAFEKPFQPAGPRFAASLKDALSLLEGKTAFLGFHGTEGEDGKMQALLEAHGISFTGSGSAASARCFDKLHAKSIVAAAGCTVAQHVAVEAKAPGTIEQLRAFFSASGKIVIKPVASGSSFGLFIVADEASLAKAIAGIQSLPYGSFLAETFVQGRELTVGVWEHDGKREALPPSEVLLNSGHSFDYQGKYLGRGSTEITPADLSPADTAAAQRLAVQAHEALGCYGYSRTDMILSEKGLVFIETNTLPGMTKASFFPQQLAAAGYDFKRFIESQLAMARARKK